MSPRGSTQTTEDTNMTTISQKMLGMLERLSEMFPKADYQKKLESYIIKYNLDNIAQVEKLQRKFEQQRNFI